MAGDTSISDTRVGICEEKGKSLGLKLKVVTSSERKIHLQMFAEIHIFSRAHVDWQKINRQLF